MKILNGTNHEVTILTRENLVNFSQEGDLLFADSVVGEPILYLPKASTPVRVDLEMLPEESVNGINVYRRICKGIVGIPDNLKPQDILLVSAQTKSAASLAGTFYAVQMAVPHELVRERRADGKFVTLGCLSISY